MGNNKFVTIFIIALLAETLFLVNFSSIVSADTNLLDGWHNSISGGIYFEKDGVITLSGDENSPGPVLVKDFTPQDDFEISLDLKAETLGELNCYPQGGGEGFNFKFCESYGHSDPSVQFELRARGGGQFLMVWHDSTCDQNGWDCNWEPFVYNGLGYTDGYEYWHPDPPQDRSESVVKPDVWYTIKIKVQKEPFVVTEEIYNEQGILLGSYQVDSINNFSFDDIHYCEMTTIQGGTFYVRNIKGIPFGSLLQSSLTISTDSNVNQVGSAVNIQGKLTHQVSEGIANEPVLLSYTFPSAVSWYPIGSALTDQDGSYSFQWLNNGSGTITLNAQWKGNDQYKPANATVTLNFVSLTDQSLFFLESNSTVTAFAFNSSSYELAFDVSGKSGTTGYVQLTIAKTLLPEAQNLKIQLDGKQLNYTLSHTGDSWILHFKYDHSTHHVNVILPKTVSTENVLVNPASTLTQYESIIAIALASLIILLSALLLFALKKH